MATTSTWRNGETDCGSTSSRPHGPQDTSGADEAASGDSTRRANDGIIFNSTVVGAVKPDPSLDEYRQKWNSLYERSNYDRGLAAYFMRRSHDWCERRFDAASHFGRVLEIGAGSGAHLRAVRHRWDEYWLTDSNPALLAQIAPGIAPPGGKVIVRREDATRLSFPDRCFDRLIATHVLEHLPEPHRVLREWARVVRPGGIISVVLPCDPGLAWRWGRHLGPRRTFIRAGIDYDYWMAREHINPIGNLVRFLRHYFDEIDECWRPCLLPSIDLNLFYVAHVRVDGDAR